MTRRRAEPGPSLRAVAIAAALSALAACDGEAPGPPEAGLPEAGPPDARPDVNVPADAAVPDAAPLPVEVYEVCGAPLFTLPVGDLREEIAGLELLGERLVFASRDHQSPYPSYQVRLFDLGTCTREQLTRDADAWYPTLTGDQVIWSDSRAESLDPYYCTDLYTLDLGTRVESILVGGPNCEYGPRTNGQALVFLRGRDLNRWEYLQTDLVLRDLALGTEAILEPAEAYPDHSAIAIGDRYVAWIAAVPLPDPTAWALRYHDLETGETFTHEGLPDLTGYFARISGPRVLAMTAQDTGYALELVDLDAATTRQVTRGESVGPQGDLDGRIVAFATDRHRPPGQDWGWDLELFDAETEVYRRITTCPAFAQVTRIQFPWLVVARQVADFNESYLALHLVDLGLVDAEGAVLEGPPVFDVE